MNRFKCNAGKALLRVALGVCAIGVASLSAAAAPDNNGSTETVSARPNVLLIVADDLGYSDLGAFGGEIPTPNLDQLANQGMLLTNHYVTPTCSPTRAALMSGTDNHLAGLGTMGELLPRSPKLQGKPGYEGYLNDRVYWLPEILRDAGYHTYMAGKWHIGKEPEQWPVARGFEQSLALINGGGSHFAPVPGKPIFADRAQYVENDQRIQLPADFYSSNSYTDKLIQYIKQDHGDGKPFFAWAAYTAPHWPLHAPDEDIAKFKGKYAAGYEAIRTARLERLRKLGLIGEDAQPNAGLPTSKDYPSWDMLSPEEQADEARRMEVYAAMVHNMDSNVGRLIQTLKDLGEYDNTLVIFMSDNGAEPTDSFFPANENTDNSLENIGRRLSNVGYGARWAEVSASPFRLFKGWTTEGGVSSPAFVRLPGQHAATPRIEVPTHVTDIAPTILDFAGIRLPEGNQYNGRSVHPISGVSLAPVLKGEAGSEQLANRVLAGELFGGRYVRSGKWKLVSVMTPFADNQWELYDLERDRSESHDVAAEHPEVVKHMVQLWDDYALKNGVVFAPNKRMPDARRGAPSEIKLSGETAH